RSAASATERITEMPRMYRLQNKSGGQFVTEPAFVLDRALHGRPRHHACMVRVEVREALRAFALRVHDAPVETEQMDVDDRVRSERPALVAELEIRQRPDFGHVLEALPAR